MSSEEEDYMSEEFLKSCIKEDIRPGLVFKQSTKRKYELEQKHVTSNEKMQKIQMPSRVLEVEKRQEGLITAISSGNKGFAMLQKMGFKPGSGLGKGGEGRVEPIALELKTDRAGLGREAAIKEIMLRKMDMLQKRICQQNDSASLNEFRSRKKDEAVQRLQNIDFNKSQRMCQILDEEKNIQEPAELWFWPEIVQESEEDVIQDPNTDKNKGAKDISKDEAKSAELETGEKLELLTSYLRQVHFYCTWCAVKFNDIQDITLNCPGTTRDDH